MNTRAFPRAHSMNVVFATIIPRMPNQRSCANLVFPFSLTLRRKRKKKVKGEEQVVGREERRERREPWPEDDEGERYERDSYVLLVLVQASAYTCRALAVLRSTHEPLGCCPSRRLPLLLPAAGNGDRWRPSS